MWPINFQNPGEMDAFDTTSLFMMQLACIVNMVPLWSKLKMRICVGERRTSYFSTNYSWQNHIEKLKNMLKKLRIAAEIVPIEEWANTLEASATNVATYVISLFARLNNSSTLIIALLLIQ